MKKNIRLTWHKIVWKWRQETSFPFSIFLSPFTPVSMFICSFPVEILAPCFDSRVSLFAFFIAPVLPTSGLVTQTHTRIDAKALFHSFPLDDARVLVVKAISEIIFRQNFPRVRRDAAIENVCGKPWELLMCIVDGFPILRFKKPQSESNKILMRNAGYADSPLSARELLWRMLEIQEILCYGRMENFERFLAEFSSKNTTFSGTSDKTDEDKKSLKPPRGEFSGWKTTQEHLLWEEMFLSLELS